MSDDLVRAADCQAGRKCRCSLFERIQPVTCHRAWRWAQLRLLVPHSKAEMGLIPGFAQVSSKPRGGLPNTKGAGFSGAFQLLSPLGHPETAERKELAVRYAGFHVAWAPSKLSWRQISGLIPLKMLGILQPSLPSASVRDEH